MGIDYSATFGYGFVLDEDNYEVVARREGYLPPGYESQEEALEHIGGLVADTWDFAEWFAQKCGLGFSVAGNSYTGNLQYLFGEVCATSNLWFNETDFNEVDIPKVDAIAAEYGFEPKWYSGIHIW